MQMMDMTLRMAEMILLVLVMTSHVRVGTAGTGLYMGPYFKDPQPLNFTVHRNNVAYLPCEVRQLGDKKVSWVRAKKEDSDILTVGQFTFVNDERFTVFKSSDTWTLVIKFVQARDSGVYECQISTEPKMALRFRLNVIVPHVEITGEAEKYVRRGSTAKLECRVSSTVELPDYIFWYHAGQRLLEYNQPRVTISVSRASGDKDKSGEMSVTSVLVIHRAHLNDAGNYTCLPSNLPNSTIRLHVLDGEHPAAMQTGSACVPPVLPPYLILAIIIVMVVTVEGKKCSSFEGIGVSAQRRKSQYSEPMPKCGRMHLQARESRTIPRHDFSAKRSASNDTTSSVLDEAAEIENNCKTVVSIYACASVSRRCIQRESSLSSKIISMGSSCSHKTSPCFTVFKSYRDAT